MLPVPELGFCIYRDRPGIGAWIGSFWASHFARTAHEAREV